MAADIAWAKERAREYREANRDAIRKYKKQYREKHAAEIAEDLRRRYAAQREVRQEKVRLARLADPVGFRAAARARRAKNIEMHLDTEAKFREKNRNIIRERARNRHFRRRKEIFDGLFKSQDGKCVYCSIGLSEKAHIDHIMPKVLGGSNDIENLQLTCPTCNFSKHARHPDVFAAIEGKNKENV